MEKNNQDYLFKRVKSNYFEIGDNEKCIECSSKNIKINRENCWVCGDCGLEYELNYRSDKMTGESRAFDSDEIISRKRTEINHAGFGARIRTFIGYYNNLNSPEIKETITRIKQLQNRHIDYRDARDRMVSTMLKKISYNLELADYVEETAWAIYDSACKKKLLKGKNIEDFISASLYTAIRVHNVPRFLKEITKDLDIDKKKIERMVQSIVVNILPDLKLTYHPVSPLSLIPVFSQELKLTNEEINKACELCEFAKKKGLKYNGKDPRGIAAASIYIVGLNKKEITQKTLYNIAELNKATLQKDIKELRKYIKKD
jgi:transcription initiation factor TFIIIB Brf1 subunit/transcription initiation factor TFIIB